MKRIGMSSYGRSGSPADLYTHYGLDTDGIRKQVAEFMRS